MGLKTQLSAFDHKEMGLQDPKSNFKQLFELYADYAYISNMAMALMSSFRQSELEEDRQYGIKLFSEHFPEDMHIFHECVVCNLPRAEIVVDEINGLYFAERIRLHPAFYLTEEGEKLLSEAKNDLKNFECVPSTPERVEIYVKIGKYEYTAPFLEIRTNKLVTDRDSMDFAIKTIHIVMQKQTAKIGGEPEW